MNKKNDEENKARKRQSEIKTKEEKKLGSKHACSEFLKKGQLENSWKVQMHVQNLC